MPKNNQIWKWAAILGGAGLAYYLYAQNTASTTAATDRKTAENFILTQIAPARTEEQMTPWIAKIPTFSDAEIVAMVSLINDTANPTIQDLTNWQNIQLKYGLT